MYNNTPPGDKIYDVVEYRIIDESQCSPTSARAKLEYVLVEMFGENAVFPDAIIGMDPATRADFMVRAKGYKPVVFFIVSRPEDTQAYEQTQKICQLWHARDAFSFTVFERDCIDPQHIHQWVMQAMAYAVKK